MKFLCLLSIAFIILLSGCSSTQVVKTMPDGVVLKSATHTFMMKERDKKFDDTFFIGSTGVPEYQTTWSVAETGGDAEFMRAMGALLMMVMKQAALASATSGAAP